MESETNKITGLSAIRARFDAFGKWAKSMLSILWREHPLNTFPNYLLPLSLRETCVLIVAMPGFPDANGTVFSREALKRIAMEQEGDGYFYNDERDVLLRRVPLKCGISGTAERDENGNITSFRLQSLGISVEETFKSGADKEGIEDLLNFTPKSYGCKT